MTQFLPDNLLALFAPRPPLEFKPPVDELLVDKNTKRPPYTGIADFIHHFEDPAETPAKIEVESRDEKKARRRKEKEELLAYKIEQAIAMWKPADNSHSTSDPYKTLFVARINYETSESKLRREFEQYGRIKKIEMVHDLSGKPRGYAFIEYSDKKDMSAAYKKADGMKIDGRRVVVDYERGRTVKSWLPRRLGGGKGETRRTRESKAVIAARELQAEPPAFSSSSANYERPRRDDVRTDFRAGPPPRRRDDSPRRDSYGGGGDRNGRDRDRRDDHNGRSYDDRRR